MRRLTWLSPGLLVLLAAACAAGRPDAAAPATLEEAPSRYARVDNIRVHYKLAGSGAATPIVFVHGWTCDMTSWTKQVPIFAKAGRVVALDLPGHGKSDKPQIAYSMDVFARAIAAVMTDAGIPRVVLVGHSMGTPVVRQFYRLYPKKTVALVAVDGSLRPFTLDPAFVDQFLAPFRGPDFRQAQVRFVDGMIPDSDPGLRDAVKAVVLETPQHVVVSAGQAMFDPAIWKEDPIDVPLLCVLAKSPFWSDDYEAFIRKLAPRLEYRILDGVGHFLMLQKPDDFNAILALFLSSLRSS
jgi:pimeloyl-ACP methyl ester carboxylesterase